jgi:tetratricopeptide (TPR) repeat protein
MQTPIAPGPARVGRLQKTLAIAQRVFQTALTVRHRDDAAAPTPHPATLEEWREAIEDTQALLATKRENAPPGAYVELGRAHRVLGNFAAAEAVIEQGLARHRDHLGMMAERAEVAAARQDWPEAAARWLRVLGSHGERVPANMYARLVRAHRLSGDFAAAEAVARDGFLRDRNHAGLAAEYAEIAMAQRHWPEAAERWQAVIAAYGERAPPVSVYSRLARAHRAIDDFTAAETAIRDGLARHPGDPGLAAEDAEIATAREDWREAITRWQAVIAAYGETAPPVSVYSRLARAHRMLGDLPAAEAAVRDGLARHPADVGLAAEHAEIATAQRDWPEVIERWRAAIKSYREKTPPARVYSRLARAYLLQGDLSTAEIVVRGGLGRHPGDIGLAAEHVEIATVQEASGRWRAAAGASSEKAAPASLYSRLAQAYRLRGDLAAAATAARDGLARHPGDVGPAAENAGIVAATETGVARRADAGREKAASTDVYLAPARTCLPQQNNAAADAGGKDGMPTEDEIVSWTKYVKQREGALDQDLLPYGNPTGKNVLVFGCGMGSEVVWAARHRASSALGVDLVPIPPEPVARVLKEYGLAEFRYEIRSQNVHDLSLTGERFDLIVSNGVFEHVFDLNGTLEALRRLLRPNGRIAIYADGLWYSSSGGHTSTFLWEHLWKDPKEIQSQYSPQQWVNWRDRCNRMTCADFIEALRSVGAIILQFNLKADPQLHYLPALIDRIRSRIQVSATDLSVVSVGCEICWEENLWAKSVP